MTDPKKRYYLYAPASDPIIIRVIPPLAEAIGLNESLLLLQLDFWIKNTNNYRDGKFWTYQSLRDIQNKAFGFWSLMTIKRTIDSLSKQQLIFTANYNQYSYDKTRWFALNPDTLRQLPYIQVTEALIYEPAEGGVSKCDRVYQNDTGVYQNDTTIPENTTIDIKEKTFAPATQDANESDSVPSDTVPNKPAKKTRTPKPVKRLHTTAAKDELLPVLVKYGKGRTLESYSQSEVTILMKTGMAQVLTALQPLDDEKHIDAMELDAAFKWFKGQHKDASYPCGANTVSSMLSNYRAHVRSLKQSKPIVATPAIDGWLQSQPITPDDAPDAEFLEQIRLARQNGAIKL